MGGRGSLRGATVSLGNDVPEIINGEFSCPYLKQSPHDGAHHVPEKPVRGYGEYNLVGVFRPTSFKHIAHEVVDLCVHLRETGEIMFTYKQFRGTVHHVGVELPETVVREVCIERVFCGVYIVFVCPALGVEAGVRLWFNGEYAEHDDLLGEEVVHLADQHFAIGGRKVRVQVEMCIIR